MRIQYIADKEFQWKRLSVRVSWRSSESIMGRFGGGWNWKLGLQAGGRSLIVSLLVLEIIFRLNKKEESQEG